jgi:hypothetical protein
VRISAKDKKRVFISIGALGVLVGIYLLSLIPGNTSNWKIAYCQIEKIVPGRNGGREFIYFVDSNEYHGWTGAGYRGATIGDIYEIMYNPKNLKEYKWVNDLPFFLPDEVIGKVVGEITYVSTVRKNQFIYVEYKYRISNIFYVRLQPIPVDSIKELKINIGDKFTVIYAPDNRQRSVLIPR